MHLADLPRGWERFATPPTVFSVGTKIYDPIWRRRHTPSLCELTHILRGEVDLIVGRRHCALRPGDTLIAPAGTPHRDVFDLAQGLQVFMATFDWPPYREYFALVTPCVMRDAPLACKAEVAQIVERLRGDVARGGEGSKLVAGARVYEVLMVYLRQAWLARRRGAGGGDSPGQRRRLALMTAAREYLSAHYREGLSLEGIAQALGVSAFHLSHVFSQESDFTLFDYLTRLRMEKARELLLEGRLKIAAVARHVGFENGNYFAKVFRRYYGFLPSECRARGGAAPQAKRNGVA